MNDGSRAVSEQLKYLRATAQTFASVTHGVALALGVSQTLLGSGVHSMS